MGGGIKENNLGIRDAFKKEVGGEADPEVFVSKHISALQNVEGFLDALTNASRCFLIVYPRDSSLVGVTKKEPRASTYGIETRA